MQIKFTIPGVPVAQPRVKATRRGAHAGVYTPEKTSTGKSNGIAEFKASTRILASQMHIGGPVVGAVRVELDFVFPRQTNKVWKSRPMPRYPKTTKPDGDNLAKSVLDSLNQVVWVDDSQVAELVVRKTHAAGNESPHTLVVISEIVYERD